MLASNLFKTCPLLRASLAQLDQLGLFFSLTHPFHTFILFPFDTSTYSFLSTVGRNELSHFSLMLRLITLFHGATARNRRTQRSCFVLCFPIFPLVIISGVCAPSNNQNFFATEGMDLGGWLFFPTQPLSSLKSSAPFVVSSGIYVDGVQFQMHIVAEDLGTGLATLPRLEIQWMALFFEERQAYHPRLENSLFMSTHCVCFPHPI